LGKEEARQQLQAIQDEICQVDQLRKRLPSGDPFDSGLRRLHSCRYADDYVIGIIGSKADAERVREKVRRFIEETLKLTIAEEKSHIRHSRQGVIFLGYEVKTYSGNRIVKVKRGPRHTLYKATSERIQLHIPAGKLERFCQSKRYGDYHTMRATARRELTELSDAEILLAYNGELQGLANYYALACNVKQRMNKLTYIWQTSFFKTLAHKHRKTRPQDDRPTQNREWVRPDCAGKRQDARSPSLPTQRPQNPCPRQTRHRYSSKHAGVYAQPVETDPPSECEAM
jgi:hypothetical protein